MKNKKIIIWGSAGHGSSVLDLARNNGFKKIIFLDKDKRAKKINNLELIAGEKEISEFFKKKNNKQHFFTVAVGSDQKIRYNIYKQLKNKNFKLPTLTHKRSNISKTSEIKDGCHIFANTNIGPNTKINECCIINNNSNVDHDCKIGKAVHIAPGAVLCGGINVGDFTLVGANATILPYLKIGSNCIIGAGATVTKNLKSGTIFYKK
jgi:sugar O-acyltransferase (sialic acid O-acetyltransferase NeuD family)